MASSKKYKFTAELTKFDGKGGWYYVDFPYNTLEEFGKKGFIRVKGTMNGLKFNRSLLPFKNGNCFIAVPLTMRKQLKIDLGSKVKVELEYDPQPRKIKVPEELLAVFDIEPEAKRVYDKQSASIRFYICQWIDEAKREETRANRAADIMRRLTSPDGSFGGRKLRE